jgi:hypothetical protein
MDAVRFNAELGAINNKRAETEKLVGVLSVIFGFETLKPLAAGAKPTKEQTDMLYTYAYIIEDGLKFARGYRDSIDRFYGDIGATAVASRVRA